MAFRVPALLALLAASPALFAQEAIEQGQPLPLASSSWTTTDGATLTFDAAAGSAGLVVIFWSDACPWVDKYAPRVQDLVDQYGRAGVGFVFVQSEPLSDQADGASTPTAPVVLDLDRSIAAALGARSAPQAFFFGPDRALAYQGAIDDSPAGADRVRMPYLQQAMDQSIAGVPVEVQSTRALGCTIKPAAE